MSGLQALKELAFSKARLRYPNVPEHALVIHKYKDKKANELARCIVDFINLNGGLAERRSNTGRYIKGKTVEDVIGITRHLPGAYIPGTGLNGTADVTAVYKGMAISIEIKIGRDTQKENQIEYQQRIESAGGIYIIAKDFEGFYCWWCGRFK